MSLLELLATSPDPCTANLIEANGFKAVVCTENFVQFDLVTESPNVGADGCAAMHRLTLCASLFKSKSRLEAENAALRHQLTVLRRKVRGRVRLTNGDRLFLIQLYRWFPSVLKAITIIRPEAIVRWHRAGFRRYWHWKSHSSRGRPQMDGELRTLIRRMSVENHLWGAPRIMANCSNVALQSRSQRSPSTWSSDRGLPQ